MWNCKQTANTQQLFFLMSGFYNVGWSHADILDFSISVWFDACLHSLLHSCTQIHLSCRVEWDTAFTTANTSLSIVIYTFCPKTPHSPYINSL